MKKLCFVLVLYVFLSFSCNEKHNAPFTKSEPTVPPINKSLALKPPMGWNSWDCFGFDANCPVKGTSLHAQSIIHSEKGGYWPDMDMLPVGRLNIKSPRSGAKPHMSNLTTDEIYSLFSLWYISRMPLFIGGYLPEMDPFTLGLISNEEALEVNRNSCNNRQIYQFETDFIVWTADIPGSKDKYVALFNISDKKNPLEIGVSWEQLGLTEPSYNVRDIWERKYMGESKDGIKYSVNSHGARLLKINEI